MKDSKVSFFERKGAGIFISVVSLVLIICLFVVGTYSWLEGGKEAEVDTSNNMISFDTDPELSITGDKVDDNQILIENFTLREVSSVDGRNVFVPDDTYNKSNSDGITSTSELRFREANEADVYNGEEDLSQRTDNNKRYVSFNFTMTSDTATPVYLSSESYIAGTGCGYVRIAIDSHEDGIPPRVISSASTEGYEVECNAVSSIDSAGTATTSNQRADALSEYMGFGTSTPLYELESGEKKYVTITVWLEGASGNFDDSITGKNDLDIRLKFSTGMDYFNEINVVDRTYGNWIPNSVGTKDTYLFIFNAENTNMNYKMTYNSATNTWTANVPQSVTKIYLQRYNPDDKTVKYNMWGSTTYPLTVPGAAALYSSGTEAEREAGLSRTYNILGTDEIEGGPAVDSYEAGIWGNLSDSAFAEVHFFDQSSDSQSDTSGYFNWDEHNIPFVNMTVTYSYDGTSVTSNIRYRMFREYVGTRLFHNMQFVGATGYTVSTAQYLDYTNFDYAKADGDDEAGALSGMSRGTKTISATSGYCSDGKRFFAYTGGSAGYWGSNMNYLGDKGIYSSDTSAPGGVRYAVKYNYNHSDTSDAGVWKDMCRWSDKNTKNGVDTSFPTDSSTEWVYAVVNPGYAKGIFCRMNGATTVNNDTNTWNYSGSCTNINSNMDCSITGWGSDKYFAHEAFSTWTNMPGR